MLLLEGSQTNELLASLDHFVSKVENQVCCDCSKPNPSWAVILQPAAVGLQALGGFCCHDCAEAHYELGVGISDVRRIKSENWNASDISILENSGNSVVNSIYEAKINNDTIKPLPTSSQSEKSNFVQKKYKQRSYYSARLGCKKILDPTTNETTSLSTSYTIKRNDSSPTFKRPIKKSSSRNHVRDSSGALSGLAGGRMSEKSSRDDLQNATFGNNDNQKQLSSDDLQVLHSMLGTTDNNDNSNCSTSKSSSTSISKSSSSSGMKRSSSRHRVSKKINSLSNNRNTLLTLGGQSLMKRSTSQHNTDALGQSGAGSHTRHKSLADFSSRTSASTVNNAKKLVALESMAMNNSGNAEFSNPSFANSTRHASLVNLAMGGTQRTSRVGNAALANIATAAGPGNSSLANIAALRNRRTGSSSLASFANNSGGGSGNNNARFANMAMNGGANAAFANQSVRQTYEAITNSSLGNMKISDEAFNIFKNLILESNKNKSEASNNPNVAQHVDATSDGRKPVKLFDSFTDQEALLKLGGHSLNSRGTSQNQAATQERQTDNGNDDKADSVFTNILVGPGAVKAVAPNKNVQGNNEVDGTMNCSHSAPKLRKSSSRRRLEESNDNNEKEKGATLSRSSSRRRLKKSSSDRNYLDSNSRHSTHDTTNDDLHNSLGDFDNHDLLDDSGDDSKNASSLKRSNSAPRLRKSSSRCRHDEANNNNEKENETTLSRSSSRRRMKKSSSGRNLLDSSSAHSTHDTDIDDFNNSFGEFGDIVSPNDDDDDDNNINNASTLRRSNSAPKIRKSSSRGRLDESNNNNNQKESGATLSRSSSRRRLKKSSSGRDLGSSRHSKHDTKSSDDDGEISNEDLMNKSFSDLQKEMGAENVIAFLEEKNITPNTLVKLASMLEGDRQQQEHHQRQHQQTPRRGRRPDMNRSSSDPRLGGGSRGKSKDRMSGRRRDLIQKVKGSSLDTTNSSMGIDAMVQADQNNLMAWGHSSDVSFSGSFGGKSTQSTFSHHSQSTTHTSATVKTAPSKLMSNNPSKLGLVSSESEKLSQSFSCGMDFEDFKSSEDQTNDHTPCRKTIRSLRQQQRNAGLSRSLHNEHVHDVNERHRARLYELYGKGSSTSRQHQQQANEIAKINKGEGAWKARRARNNDQSWDL